MDQKELTAQEIVEKLIDEKKISGKEAVILLNAINKPAEDWKEKRKEECPFRRNLDNNLYGCERYAGLVSECNGICSWVVDYPKLKEIQDKRDQERQMPDSTQLIEEWEKEKAVLEQKDFRGDAERMAYNAFLDGFIKGLGYEGTK